MAHPWRMIDADGHIREVESDVFEYLPEHYKKRREAVLYFPLLPHHGWHRQAGHGGMGGSFLIPTLQDWQLALDQGNIEAAVVYPTRFMHIGQVGMMEFAVDLSRAYNDYLYDRFLRDEKRLKGIAVLPLQDVPAAVIELRRAVKDYGMVGGVFTPTESASIAAVYSLFVALVVFRSLKLRQLTKLFAETTIQFSQVLFCLGGASIFGWLLAYYQVPQIVTDFITAFTRDPIMIMILIVIVNVLLGTFMDALPAILIFVPIIHPLAVAVGIHPVHLGVIVVMTQSFGLLTPPLGMVAMTACAVAGVPMIKIQKLLHIMMIPLLIVIVLCALAPWTVLLLPKLLVPKWL